MQKKTGTDGQGDKIIRNIENKKQNDRDNPNHINDNIEYT